MSGSWAWLRRTDIPYGDMSSSLGKVILILSIPPRTMSGTNIPVRTRLIRTLVGIPEAITFPGM